MMKVIGFLLLCMCTFTYAEEERIKSACEEDRERRLGATTPASLHLIPNCDENGDYSALQCYTGNDWCVCYRRNGENINTPSKKIKSCDCVRARDDAVTNGDDYVPKCSPDGYYLKQQCSGRECWCVDKDGNQVSDPVRVGGDFLDLDC